MPRGKTFHCIERLVWRVPQSLTLCQDKYSPCLEAGQAAGISASLLAAAEMLPGLAPSHYRNTAGGKVMHRDDFLRAPAEPTGQSRQCEGYFRSFAVPA